MVVKRKKIKPDNEEQSARFMETAKQIEPIDKTPETSFKDALSNIVKKKCGRKKSKS